MNQTFILTQGVACARADAQVPRAPGGRVGRARRDAREGQPRLPGGLPGRLPAGTAVRVRRVAAALAGMGSEGGIA